MANKTILYGSQSLDHDDSVRYVELESGVYALATVSVLAGQRVSGATELLAADEMTGTLVTMPSVHHRVHEGEMFSASHFSLVNANGEMIALMLRTTGTFYAHLTFSASGGGDVQVRFHENPNVSNSGNLLTPRNMKRSDNTLPGVVASGGPTYADGDILVNYLVAAGADGRPPVLRQGAEWILNLNTDYIIEVTNLDAGNQPLSIVAQWYEETSA